MHLSQLSSEGQITVPKEIQDLLSLKPGDLITYEVQKGAVIVKRVGPFDVAFHQALSATLDEWNSPEDDEAFRDL